MQMIKTSVSNGPADLGSKQAPIFYCFLVKGSKVWKLELAQENRVRYLLFSG